MHTLMAAPEEGGKGVVGGGRGGGGGERGKETILRRIALHPEAAWKGHQVSQGNTTGKVRDRKSAGSRPPGLYVCMYFNR